MVTFLTPLARLNLKSKGSLGPDFSACPLTGGTRQADFCPCALHKISVLIESTFGHSRYLVKSMPPQPNSPSECFPEYSCAGDRHLLQKVPSYGCLCLSGEHSSDRSSGISKSELAPSHLFYTFDGAMLSKLESSSIGSSTRHP